jgi:hypothetical protein
MLFRRIVVRWLRDNHSIFQTMHSDTTQSTSRCERQAHQQLMAAFFKIITGKATEEDRSHYLQAWAEGSSCETGDAVQ